MNLAYNFRTEARTKKIIAAVENRQYDLRLVLENIHDPHNVSAIFRTCDAVGVPIVDLLYTIENFPKLSRVSSSSANKWVHTNKFVDVCECVKSLKKDDFLIYASACDLAADSLYSLDLTKKIAFVIGNEHRGVSEEMLSLSDKKFFIPMKGMVQSLNVSVAAAVMLYETLRQRELAGMYPSKNLDPVVKENIIKEWLAK